MKDIVIEAIYIFMDVPLPFPRSNCKPRNFVGSCLKK
jgi:hypothetical protein